MIKVTQCGCFPKYSSNNNSGLHWQYLEVKVSFLFLCCTAFQYTTSKSGNSGIHLVSNIKYIESNRDLGKLNALSLSIQEQELRT